MPLDELRYFSNVFAIIKNNYVENIDDKVMIDNAISGMASNLDPHSSYLNMDDYKEIQSVTNGKFGGLGIEVSFIDGLINVISVIEGSPADLAGIIQGDQIIKIDHVLTQRMTLHEAVKMMRGEPGSSVVLSILRQKPDTILVFNIVREVVKIDSVRSKMINGDVLYMRIMHFQEKTMLEMIEHFKQMNNQKEIRALILDLRDNPGGLLSSAIEVAGVFLDSEALIVSTRGRTVESNIDYFSCNECCYSSFTNIRSSLRNIPMLVLVNSGSASASEIVAGAIQDYDRAKIFGDITFGKGSVQAVLPLDNFTGLKLTISRYFTPLGKSIQAEGIHPDYIIIDDSSSALSFKRREVDLKGHLSNINDNLLPEIDMRESQINQFHVRKDFNFGDDNDFQLKQAIHIFFDLLSDNEDSRKKD
ncbi:carboxyl-terminal processing protease [Candidatus Kinetoplastibacterium crithidii (ex Angomonas deanei ATCC 30255)]|nr:carboxyl-terminal processing protease [Candidatus Kinetoplastibacterium crithidii (ex Angomonas deanei ATCC 30255)]